MQRVILTSLECDRNRCPEPGNRKRRLERHGKGQRQAVPLAAATTSCLWMRAQRKSTEQSLLSSTGEAVVTYDEIVAHGPAAL